MSGGDQAAERCEAIYQDNLLVKGTGIKELFVLMWRDGKSHNTRDYSAGYLKGYEDALKAAGAIFDKHLPPLNEEREGKERQRTKYASWIDDPVQADRRALANEINSRKIY